MHAETFSINGRAATGIEGLDQILGGGFPRNRLHLVEGNSGTGKTTLALQFLRDGCRRNEPCLFITLSETRDELLAVARSHGWSLDGILIHEMVPPEENLRPEAQYTLFHPSEVELGETIRTVFDEVDRIKPARVVFDSLAELRLLTQDNLQYRRQILSLKQFFAGRRCTVLLLDDRSNERGEPKPRSLAHGVLLLEQLAPLYGAERRRLRVIKMRGVRYRGGFHDFKIETGGLAVFPRLVAAEHQRPYQRDQLASGVPGLDLLLGGGLSRGTSTLIIGPAGVGKSALAARYALSAAHRGERATVFVFDESVSTYLARSVGLGMDMTPEITAGRLLLQQVDPAELCPGEFIQRVRRAVEQEQTRVLVIDSLNGYLNAMPEERFLTLQLHELLMYLGHQGVVTILVVAQHGILGGAMQTPLDISYLADKVVLLRNFEANGEVRQAISVVKKRCGPHERTVREYQLGPRGLDVGPPLREFHNVLTGVPVFGGRLSALRGESHERAGA